jgi:hypothetical protein
MGRAARVYVISCLLGLGGCGTPPTGPASDTQRAVVLGTGEAEFEDMQGEPLLNLVAGVQGGFHVWASFLAYGFSSPDLDLSLTTSVEDAPESRLVMHARSSLRETLDAAGEIAYTFAGFPAQVYEPRCAQGKRVRLEVSLSDAQGGVAGDVRECRANLDTAERAPSCD